MTSILRERVQRIALGPYLSYAANWTMRLWRSEPAEGFMHVPGRIQVESDVHAAISRFVQFPVTPRTLATAILELERVNAVEIVDATGSGERLSKNVWT